MGGGTTIDNPILNSPYDAPSQHFELSPQGPTGNVLPGRRPSESFIPVPAPRKGARQQLALDFDATGERLEANPLINDIRVAVDRWRRLNYQGVTAVSRKLLQHWANPERENRVMFCQREAAETGIFLAEVAGRHGYPDFNRIIGEHNGLHNDGLPRVATKMATGTGKTIVMAMLIAWQTVNKVYSPRDARFTKRFLVVTPGITIRDRLRVIQPSDPDNYYKARDLVPPDLWGALREAEIIIANYHAFLPKTAKEFEGVSPKTRKLATYHTGEGAFTESDDQIASRVLRQFGGKGKLAEIVVLNDEAHHCYQNKPLDPADADQLDAAAKKEADARNEDARVWFKGLRAVHKKIGIKTVYDLSATPYYLSGSGYAEGFIFPWTVSDFSLMDAIESGVVKVPRMPVDDDATSPDVTYLHLWDHVGKELPKRAGKKVTGDAGWVMPKTLDGALRSLYNSYAKAFINWDTKLKPLGEPPPVMIVVCPNTLVSKLVYDWIAGADIEAPNGDTIPRPGELDLLSNVVNGTWLTRPRTILIDSAQLESGETLKDDFKKAAAHEIDGFKHEMRTRNPGLDVETITDEDLLREVMNTVGKRGKLGEQIRCVVSVSMLTEGWDANTVTHILGIRAFGSQLLCEQVIGRGLRRRDYTVNEHGMFDPEYAEVYGVPFAFIPTDGKTIVDPKPKPIPLEVKALPERAHLRITFPRLTGYRVELPPDTLTGDFDDPDAQLHVDKTTFATWTKVSGVVGPPGEHSVNDEPVRLQEAAYDLAAEVLKGGRLGLGLDQNGEATVPFHTRFPQLVAVAKQWLEQCVTYEPGLDFWVLSRIAEWRHRATEQLEQAIILVHHETGGVLSPVLDRFNPVGTTDDVAFFTRKALIDTVKSPVNRATLDGIKGNTWEETVAGLLERHPDVYSWVKNDGLDFYIPYVHAGTAYDYKPDFLVKLNPRDPGDESERYLIIEVSGTMKDKDKRIAKAETTETKWWPAVNRHGGFGRWGFTEIADMTHAESNLNNAIDRMYQTELEKAMND